MSERQKKSKKNTAKLPPIPGTRRRSFSSCFGLIAMLVFSLICSVLILSRQRPVSHDLSQEQLKVEVQNAAARYGLSDHLDELYAIIEVESDWKLDDVFQSSESLGLAPNTLGVYESIDQGCRYYKSLLEKGEQLGVDQDAIFQAYNYGSGYLDYVAEHGGRHTKALAEEFSKIYSNGKVVSYPNPVAIASNGGWRYDYGNMFYVDLIHQAL